MIAPAPVVSSNNDARVLHSIHVDVSQHILLISLSSYPGPGSSSISRCLTRRTLPLKPFPFHLHCVTLESDRPPFEVLLLLLQYSYKVALTTARYAEPYIY